MYQFKLRTSLIGLAVFFLLNAKAQTWLWAKSGVPDDYCSSNAIAVSPQGNVIEAGAFNGFAYFSGNTITSKGSTIGVVPI